jgi:hypothetical protein
MGLHQEMYRVSFSKKSQICLITGVIILLFGLSGVPNHIFASATNGVASAPPEHTTSLSSPFGAIPFSPNSPASYHWYAGGVYSGSSGAVYGGVSTVIKVPSGAPKANQFYYEILSIWDSANSYDQLGFAAKNGHWGLAYSSTTGSCSSPTYVYNASALALTPGTTYKFVISISTGFGGGVFFNAYVGSKNVFFLLVSDGATYFHAASAFCNSYDYTVYQEAYMPTSSAVPSFNFVYTANYYYASPNLGSKSASGLAAFYVKPLPSVVKVAISGTSHNICKITN